MRRGQLVERAPDPRGGAALGDHPVDGDRSERERTVGGLLHDIDRARPEAEGVHLAIEPRCLELFARQFGRANDRRKAGHALSILAARRLRGLHAHSVDAQRLWMRSAGGHRVRATVRAP